MLFPENTMYTDRGIDFLRKLTVIHKKIIDKTGLDEGFCDRIRINLFFGLIAHTNTKLNLTAMPRVAKVND